MSVIHQTQQKIQQANATQSASKIILWHLIIGLVLSVLFTVVFVRIFDFYKDSHKDVTPFDRSLLFWMYHHRAPWLTQAAKFLALMGSPPVMVGLAVVAVAVGSIWRKVRGAAWTLPIAIVGAGVIIQSVKLLVHRPRPSFFTPLLHEAGYSFPSGHSLIAMVVYGLLGYFALNLFRNEGARLLIRIVTVVIVVLIGVSRVYVGVHYPTDVLAGWTAGVPWLIACLGLHEVLSRRWPASGEPVLTQQADKDGGRNSGKSAVKTLLKG
jgi:undecaprenyl-diphosphatase